MKQTIGKYVFLDTLNCSLLGWMNQQGLLPSDDSPFARQQMEQGREINRLSRELFPEGGQIPDVNFTMAEKRMAAMIAGTADITLFEAVPSRKVRCTAIGDSVAYASTGGCSYG